MSTPPTSIWAPESDMLILVMDLSTDLGRGSSSSLYPDVHRLMRTWTRGWGAGGLATQPAYLSYTW